MRMKLFIIFLFSFSTLLCASDARFTQEYGYMDSYQEAKSKALAHNKPMMILFVTASCPWCQKLKHQTLKKDDVNTIIHDSFIPVILDKETDDFPQGLTPMVVPTIVFIEPKNETKFFEIIGYKTVGDFLELSRQARNAFSKLRP